VCDELSVIIEYPTYTDADGVEWDSREDYEIAKYIAYRQALERRNSFADVEVSHDRV
jgi:hypothetical protein